MCLLNRYKRRWNVKSKITYFQGLDLVPKFFVYMRYTRSPSYCIRYLIFHYFITSSLILLLLLGQICCRARLDQGGTSGAKPLELRFINKLPDKIFTLSNILAEDEKTPLQVVLFDVRSQSVVTNGSLSSAKVEILALNGVFCSNGRENWTEEEFNASILRQREGREPLLKGDRFVTLKDGIGCIDDIKFTDNSRWVSNGKFMLGAKVVQSTSCGVSIKEGKSEPFVVRDIRGEGKYTCYLN